MLKKFLRKIVQISGKSKLLAHIDSADNCTLKGWAFDRNQPNKSLAIDVFTGNKLLCSGKANLYRSDLKSQGFGNGEHGFNIPIPKKYSADDLSINIQLKNKKQKFLLVKGSILKLKKDIKSVSQSIKEKIAPADIELVKVSGIFNQFFFESFSGHKFENENAAIQAYLQDPNYFKLAPHPLFDVDFYLSQVISKPKNAFNPLLHYLKKGAHENLNPCAKINWKNYEHFFERNTIDEALLCHFLRNFFPKTSQIESKIIPRQLVFNAKYYIKNNPDVQKAGIPADIHFLNNGWKEKRNPNELFKTQFYQQLNEDVAKAGINPFLHYIFYGFWEKRATYRFLKTDLIKNLLLTTNTKLTTKSVDIIVPIYNGLNLIKKLFESIKNYTHTPYRLIAINDASTDKDIRAFLKSQSKIFDEFVLIENPRNLGFVKSVNVGLEIIERDVVILNSDTEVVDNWLQRLMQPIWTNTRIASVTPLTNAGTIASFPFINQDNPLFLDFLPNEIDDLFKNFNPQLLVEVPTGVGFCMAMSELAIKDIGTFDEINFDKGYGEENDWCRRAAKSGYSNALLPSLFIWHKHGGSFTSVEKQKLIAKNTKKLLKKHPEYWDEVRIHLAKDPLESVRFYSMIALSAKQSAALCLNINHQLGGGATAYLNKNVDIKKNDVPQLILTYNFNIDCYELKLIFKDYSQTTFIENHQGLFEFLELLPITKIFFNNAVSFPETEEIIVSLGKLSNQKAAKLEIAVHDYHAICPSFTLLNDRKNYCGAETNKLICQSCIIQNTFITNKKTEIDEWRQSWLYFLKQASEIVFFSLASKQLFDKVFQELDQSKLFVTPHKPLQKVHRKPQLKVSKKDMNIGVLGNINFHKGAEKIKELAGFLAQNGEGKIIIIGNWLEEVTESNIVKTTGTYKFDDLPRIIENEAIDVFYFPSIWPETFSYVTQELMQLELPILAFEIGAPAERLKSYILGKLVSLDCSTKEIYKALENLNEAKNQYVLNQYFLKAKDLGLFDSNYYSTISKINSKGIDSFIHYLEKGWLLDFDPSETFNQKVYLSLNPDVKKVGINPLWHYLNYGIKEGRLYKKSGDLIFNQNISSPVNMGKIAVLIHAYYEDLINELLDKTKALELPFDILISVVSEDGKQIVEDWQEKNHLKSRKIYCKLVENRGRDMAPAFVTFGNQLKNYALVCKLHTKKSLYTGAEQIVWRKQLVNNVIGNKIRVNNILHWFNNNPKLGMLYPSSELLPYWAYTWLSNKNIAVELEKIIGVALNKNGYIDYPMGSMLWFRPEALPQLLNNKLQLHHFAEEPCGNDGTIAHALERALAEIARRNGFTIAEINFEKSAFFLHRGRKNLHQYAKFNLNNLLEKIDEKHIISFDVFDTLIARIATNPNDIRNWIERELNKRYQKNFQFIKHREIAELKALSKLKRDVNLNEIYEFLAQEPNFNKTIANDAQSLELKFEETIAIPRKEMQQAFNYAKEMGKKIMLVSDMYLPKEIILGLLEHCGYNCKDVEIYVSNELNARKDSGKMWDYLISELKIEKQQLLHIGDNEHSDIQQTVDRNIDSFHIMSANNLLENARFAEFLKTKNIPIFENELVAFWNSSLFNNPFCKVEGTHTQFNPLKNALETGKLVFGPMLYSFYRELIETANTDGIEHLYFLAREGHLLLEMYQHFCSIHKQQNPKFRAPKASYLLISRRAVMGAMPKNKQIIHNILTNNHFDGLFEDLLEARFGVTPNNVLEADKNFEIKLPEDLQLITQRLQNYMPQIATNTKAENKALITYLENIKFKTQNAAFVDIGYSASIQKFLHEITKIPMCGYYFISRDTALEWQNDHNKVKGFFGHGVKKDDQTAVFKFNLYLEAWLSAPEGQLKNFIVENGKAIPVFSPKESVKKDFFINEKIAIGCVDFFKSVHQLEQANPQITAFSMEASQLLFEFVVKEDLWDKEFRKIAYLEDLFCGKKEAINVIEAYKNMVLDKAWLN